MVNHREQGFLGYAPKNRTSALSAADFCSIIACTQCEAKGFSWRTRETAGQPADKYTVKTSTDNVRHMDLTHDGSILRKRRKHHE